MSTCDFYSGDKIADWYPDVSEYQDTGAFEVGPSGRISSDVGNQSLPLFLSYRSDISGSYRLLNNSVASLVLLLPWEAGSTPSSGRQEALKVLLKALNAAHSSLGTMPVLDLVLPPVEGALLPLEVAV